MALSPLPGTAATPALDEVAPGVVREGSQQAAKAPRGVIGKRAQVMQRA